jgi:hypothetical protein
MISSLLEDSSDGLDAVLVQIVCTITSKVLDVFCKPCEKMFIVSRGVQKEKKKSKLNTVDDLKVFFGLYISCFIVCKNICMLRLIVVELCR